MVLIFRDVTQEYKLRNDVEQSEKKYSSLFNTMLEGFALHEMTYDKNGKANGYVFLDVNPAFEKMVGVNRSDVIGKNVLEILPNLEKEWIEKYEHVAMTGQPLEFEQHSHELGKYFHVSAFCPKIGQFANVFNDVTESRESHDKLMEVSTRDFLTQIYNRRYIYDRMESLSSEFKRTGKTFSVAILDIDHFKDVNDQYGHQAGDYVLVELSRIIEKTLRSYDLFGRYGGEEFIMVFPETKKINICQKMEFVLDIIRNTKFKYNGDEVSITFSCGIVDSGEITESFSVDKLIEVADKRLYTIKQKGRNGVCIE